MTTTTLTSPQAAPGPGQGVTGPAGMALLGNTLQFQRDPLGFLMDTAAAYGDVARYRLGNITFFQINHPAGIQRVLQDNHHNYIKGDLFDIIRQFAGNGLFPSEGELWLRQRRLMQPAFHQRRLALLVDGMTSEIQVSLDHWAQAAQKGQVINMAEETTALAAASVVAPRTGWRPEAAAPAGRGLRPLRRVGRRLMGYPPPRTPSRS